MALMMLFTRKRHGSSHTNGAGDREKIDDGHTG
jgi:hypothetical protein